MKKGLAALVKSYIVDKSRRKRLAAVVCALSLLTALGVYSALMLPAIGKEKANPLLTADAVGAVFGGELRALITATAETDAAETYFYLSAFVENAELADTLAFDSAGTAQVSTNSGVLTLHRVTRADGAFDYWFALEKGASVHFALPYISKQIETLAESIPDEETPLAPAPEGTDAAGQTPETVPPTEAPAEEDISDEPEQEGAPPETASPAEAPAEEDVSAEPAQADTPAETDGDAAAALFAAEATEFTDEAVPAAAGVPAQLVYTDPDSACVEFHAASGTSLEAAQAAAEAGRRKPPALTLRWMTAEELAALPKEEAPGEEADDETDEAVPEAPEMPEMPDGATSWATVEKAGYAPPETETVQALSRMAASLDGSGMVSAMATTGIDFGQYISSATVSKLQNGSWVQATEFASGDTVRVGLAYVLPANTVGADNKTISYQLPTGIVPGKLETGTVYDGSAAVGVYSISTDGLITMTFNDSFADSRPFSGTIQFQGTVSANEDGSQNNASFGSSGLTISIKPATAPTDLSMAKTGSYTSATGKITYKVTASTSKGTEGVVTITDQFQSGNTGATYDQSSFKVYQVSAGGARTLLTGYTPVITASDGRQKFTLSNLPKLNAGERYEVEYTAAPGATNDANGNSSVANSARGTSGNSSSETWNSVTISRSMLQKNGGYDTNTGKISWTITINPDKKDISGYKLTDTMTIGGQNVPLPGTVTLKNSAGTASTVSLPYTFPANAKDTYTITYTTDAPSGTPGSSTTVNNRVDLTKAGSPGYTVSTGVGVNHKGYGVVKRYNGSSTVGVYNWTAEITVPASGVDLSKLTYTDAVSDAIVNGTILTNSHYTTAQLLGGMTVTLSNGTTLTRGTDYRILDAAGSVITDFNGTSALRGFRVEFLSAAQSKLGGATIILRYSTKYSPETGKSYVLGNNGAIPGYASNAEYRYDAPKLLEKQASVGGIGTGYKSDSQTVDFEAVNGVLYYRLLLRTDASTAHGITLTDTLPAGAKLVEDADSVKALFYGNDWWQYDTISTWDPNISQNRTYSLKTSLHYTTTPNTDGTTTLAVTIDDGYTFGSDYKTIAVYYKLSLSEDTYWENLSNEAKTYINRAVWNGLTERQSTTVNRKVATVAKSGEQLKDEEGNPSSTIRYAVTINPAGADLATGADTITLTDTLSTNAGASFLADSVKLYRYDGSKADKLGPEISRDRYRYTYDDLTHKLSFTLPDSTPCILVYDYFIVRGLLAGDITVNNSVNLSGNINEGTNNKTVLVDSSSSATASKKTVTIYKVDGSDYSKLLPGAAFKLESYTRSGGNWRWSDVAGGTYITDADGKIAIDFAGTDVSLSNNVLYRLTETAAPAGYQRSSEPYYFVWMADGKTQAETVSAMTQAAFGGVSTDQVRFVTVGGAVVYVPNAYTRLSVKKLWQNQNGETIAPTSGSVDLTLYRQPKKPDGYTVKVTVKGSGAWASAPLQLEQLVAKGSPLTITVTGEWNLTHSISYGSTTASFTATGAAASYTIASISEDTNITIVCGSYHPLPATLSGFTNPIGMTEAGGRQSVQTLTLNAGNGWSWSGEALEKEDGEGHPYYYWVEEAVPSGSRVSYMNNGGIQTGDITVTNTVSSQRLPETGGPGRMPFTLIGVLLMALSGAAALILRKKQWLERRRN